MPVTNSKSANLETAEEYISSGAKEGADILALPEMFLCPYENESFRANAESAGGGTCQRLSSMAAKHRVWIVGGSFPEVDGEKLYNTSFVFDREGRQRARHRKIHLFDIDVPGGQRFCESDIFSPGEHVTVFNTEYGAFGLCICFDMRFPLLSLEMALRGAKGIFVPAAFNMTTGPVHWELMFRSRAVDNQLFTFGIAPARDEGASYVSYGHSIVCDPWGTVLYQGAAEPAVKVVEIDLSQPERIREQLPLIKGIPYPLPQIIQGGDNDSYGR